MTNYDNMNYIAHNKTFTEKCDANEYSYALCRDYSRHVIEWKIMNVQKRENIVGGYYVWDLNSKSVVLEMAVFEL